MSKAVPWLRFGDQRGSAWHHAVSAALFPGVLFHRALFRFSLQSSSAAWVQVFLGLVLACAGSSSASGDLIAFPDAVLGKSASTNSLDQTGQENICAPLTRERAEEKQLIVLLVCDERSTHQQTPAEEGEQAQLSSRIDAYQEEIGAMAAGFRYDSPSFITPLVELGDLYASSGLYDKNLESLDRALYLLRINYGLNNPLQIPLVDRQAQSHLAMGNLEEASKRQHYAYFLIQVQYREDPLEALSSEHRLAKWYLRVGDVELAASYYQKIIRIIEKHQGPVHLSLIAPLKGLAAAIHRDNFPDNTIRSTPFTLTLNLGDNRNPMQARPTPARHVNEFLSKGESYQGNSGWARGERVLRRIVDIYSEHLPGMEVELAESLLALADWHTLFRKARRANSLYLEAISTLSTISDRQDVLSRNFDVPLPLYVPRIKLPGYVSPADADGSKESQGAFIEMEYTVGKGGGLHDIKTAGASHPELLRYRVGRDFREARYRPRFVDDNPVTARAAYRHHYLYNRPPGSEESDI